MYFKVWRDSSLKGLRKVMVELWSDQNALIDRRRMFAFPLVNFYARLSRKMARMKRLDSIMNACKRDGV